MSGATLAEVQLDGVRRPDARGFPHHDEVDREATPCTHRRQATTDSLSVVGDGPGILRRGGRDTPQVALPARSAEHLVVRREDLYVAAGQHPKLDTGAAYL